MNYLRLYNASKSYDSRLILKDVFFRLVQGERVGLIGKNGVGKSTVLNLILKREEPTSGLIEVSPEIKVGYFSQFSELKECKSILNILDETFAPIHAMEQELKEIEHLLAHGFNGKKLEQIVNRQAELLEEMERHEGWTYQYKINTVLTKLGFPDRYRSQPVSKLSGGWRNRAALAKILLEDPDVLLLDEPTNYLDMEGLTWLEEWLTKFHGALILVSHDRQFLNQVVNRIVEIENFHFHEYLGDFTQYVREKKLRSNVLEKQFEHEAELLAFEEEAIEDFKEARKNPSKALKRRLANIHKQVAPRPVDKICTNLYKGLKVGNLLGHVENISKFYDEQSLFKNVSFDVYRGDRVAIIGPNGCGKTTLVKVLTGVEALSSGKIEWSKNVQYCYYNDILEHLDLEDTVTHSVNTMPLAFHENRKYADQFLALMQFSPMDLKQRIGDLSGGQKARVALAQCLLSGASVVILDEPTNHLDITSTQVMERALVNFPGAVLVVSHDRFFIHKLANRLLIFEDKDRVRWAEGCEDLYKTIKQERNVCDEERLPGKY